MLHRTFAAFEVRADGPIRTRRRMITITPADGARVTLAARTATSVTAPIAVASVR